MTGFTLICCVVNIGDASKTLHVAKKYGIKGGTITIGKGTIHSRLLDFLHINEIRKEIVTMLIENELAAQAIQGISQDMEFHKPHHGIAFSYAVPELIGTFNIVSDVSETEKEGSGMYKIIYVIVEKGRAEDVIDAAMQAGARGGTITNARGAGIHEVQKLFSIDIEPEKEIIFILTTEDAKQGIVDSIKSHLQIDEPGNGIMYVLDVNEVYGLHNA